MKMIKIKALTITTVCLLFLSSLIGCTNQNKEDGKRLIDCAGDEVVLPANPKRVINNVIYGGQIMITLGLGDYLIGVNEDIAETPWLDELYPRINQITKYEEHLNAEALLSAKPDVVIVEKRNDAIELRSKGINAVVFKYYSITEFKYAIDFLGKLLNETEKTDAYINYFDAKTNFVKASLDGKIEKKRSLYYINGVSNKGLYKTTGKGSTNSELAGLSYVEFATDSLISSPQNYVDSEAIIKKNPENIIIGGKYQHLLYKKLYETPEWNNVSALKNDCVFTVPMGIAAWNRYGAEMALMIPWTANVVYPEYTSFDTVKEIQNFYKTFTDCEVSAEHAQYMIKGLMPNGEKEVN